MNTSLKIPVEPKYTKYGKEYAIEYIHKRALWQKYRILYTINNAKYEIKQYQKST